MNTQAVILVGGLGTRLRSVTEAAESKIPKALVPVNGKPFLYWQLRLLKDQGVKNVLLLCAYLGEQIRETFGDGKELGLQIDYSFEPEPLGTGGALKLALPKLKDEFFLFNGDSFLNIDMEDMLEFFEESEALAVISAYRDLDKTDVPANLMVNEGDDRGGVVSKYEKGAGRARGFNAIDSGVYLLRKYILQDAPNGKFQLEDLWSELIGEEDLGAYFETEKFFDIGTPERLKAFEERLSDYF